MLNKDLTHKNFIMISETASMNDPAQFTPNLDRFARELAVALRRILGIAESAGMQLPTVTDEACTQTPNQEITHE